MTFTRNLFFEINGELKKGEIIIMEPIWDPERGKWACYWSISFIHPEFFRFHGDDPLSAHLTTIDFISSLIRGSQADGLNVWWNYEGDHGGMTFPLCEEAAVKGWKAIDEVSPESN